MASVLNKLVGIWDSRYGTAEEWERNLGVGCQRSDCTSSEYQIILENRILGMVATVLGTHPRTFSVL